MGVDHLIRILTLAVFLPWALGISRLTHHYIRHPTTFHTIKEFSYTEAMPFKDYDLELLKPMSQMRQRKHVPLHLIPQSSFHVYPTTSTHLPAVEIPLSEPLVLTAPVSEVLAPMGFNVLLHGTFCSFYTAALLAPVPSGYPISGDTPIVINVLYAIPKIPSFQNQNAVTKIPASQSTMEEDAVQPVRGTTPDPIVMDDDTITVPLQDAPVNEPVPFENAKESPYLQELRLESLHRQVQELQAKIRKIKRLRN